AKSSPPPRCSTPTSAASPRSTPTARCSPEAGIRGTPSASASVRQWGRAMSHRRLRGTVLSVRGWFAPLMLAAARGRRRPVRWLLPALGIALAAAFAIGVAAQSQVAGDQAARSVLNKTSPLDTEVRVTWQGPVSPSVADRARTLMRGLGSRSPTEVVLMNPVRLGGVVVRPAAIAPLGRWLSGAAPARLGSLGPCRPEGCPVLLVGGGPVPSTPPPATVPLPRAGAA